MVIVVGLYFKYTNTSKIDYIFRFISANDYLLHMDDYLSFNKKKQLYLLATILLQIL